MAYTFTVPQGYGYVLLVSLGAVPFTATALAFFAGSMRKAAGVSYPNFYPTPQAVKENKDAYKYTCAQRSHANYMENMPQAMLSMLVAGLTYPRASAALGVGWLVSRMLYMYGYVYGKKEMGMGRAMGSGFWLCQGALWGMCISTALTLL